MPTQTNFVVGESETRWGRGSVHHRSKNNVKSESQEDGHHHETRIKWLRQFSKQASSPNLETHAQMQVVSRAQPSLWPGWCRVHAYSPPVNSRQLPIFCVPVFGLVRFRFLIRDGVRDRLLGQLGHRGRRNFFGLVVAGSKPGWFFWFPGVCSRQCFAL